MDKDLVLIIDGLNFIYRGVLNFSSSDKSEQDFTIVYSFFRNLRSLIELIDPTKCFFALEGNPKFRKELFPAYKANRLIKIGSHDKRKDVLRQADLIIALLKHLPISTIKAEDFEADDVIATLAHNLCDEKVVIISSDSDLIQILQSSKGEVALYNATKKEYVIPPSYPYLAWKCLAGDKKSDNIPGIVSEDEATRIASNPSLLISFLKDEEKKANFILNRNLIELRQITDQQLIINEGKVNFDLLFLEFEKMKFNSLLENKYKDKFIKTFEKLCYVK